MGGKGGGGGGGETRVMFAPYIERVHSMVLDATGTATFAHNILEAVTAAYSSNPYDSMTSLDPKSGFTAGDAVTTYPALFDMFGKFMASQELDVLWTDLYELSQNGTEVDEAIASQSTIIQDEIDSKILPKFLAGMRDINSVMSSAFVAGKFAIAKAKINDMAEFTSKLKLKQFDVAQARFENHLNWNKAVVGSYQDIMKMYYAATYDYEARTNEISVKGALWELTLYDYIRAMLGALNGAAAAKPENQPSQAAKSIAGVTAGAAAGASIGSMIKDGSGSYAGTGAVAGGVLGLAASFA